MSGLFKKLNILVRASVQDALGDLAQDASRRRLVDPARLGKDMDREVASLRERIDEAIAHENTLRVNLDSLYSEIARLDQAADEAVKQGDQAQARYLIARMQQIRRRAEMAEADLREHQIVTEEFIQRVNLLDAVVADARRQQESEPSAEQVPDSDSVAAPASSGSGPVRALSDMLRDARERVTQAGDAVQHETEKVQAELETDDRPSAEDGNAVDDDLAARLKRLSKPD